MNYLAVDLLALLLALAGLVIIVWQWRTGDLIDPILSGFAPGGWKRPLIWFTTLIYGSVTIVAIVAVFHL